MDVLSELRETGVVHLKAFFPREWCDIFLENNKHLLDKKQDLSLEGYSGYGDILIKDNVFYGKKAEYWEAFKLDLDKHSNSVELFVKELENLKIGTLWSCQFLIKKRFLKDALPCHRDNEYKENIRYYNSGVYLTDSTSEDAVYYYPGTHKNKDINYIKEEKTFITAKKGDVIIHDSYAWHGSLNDINEGRSTLYIKFKNEL